MITTANNTVSNEKSNSSTLNLLQSIADRNPNRVVTYCGRRILPTNIKEQKSNNVAPRKKADRKATGTRVKIFGYSVTAVLRWMGANGWEFEDAAIAVETLGEKRIADVTVRLQLKAGRDGKRGAPADITASQARRLREASK